MPSCCTRTTWVPVVGRIRSCEVCTAMMASSAPSRARDYTRGPRGGVGHCYDDVPMISRRGFLRTVSASLLAAPLTAEAQRPNRVWRIGFLGPGSYSVGDPRVEALRRGLRELGYAEGQNLAFEFRWAGGNANRLSGLAAELRNLRVDAIVTQGTQATDVARRVVSAIPIVFAVAGDPVGTGLVTS